MDSAAAALDVVPEGPSVAYSEPDSPIAAAFTPSETTALQSFLGASTRDASKLTAIAEFVRGEKAEFTDVDLLHAVRTLETKLGLPPLGQRRVDQVYAYVTLQRQIDSLERERNALLR